MDYKALAVLLFHIAGCAFVNFYYKKIVLKPVFKRNKDTMKKLRISSCGTTRLQHPTSNDMFDTQQRHNYKKKK